MKVIDCKSVGLAKGTSGPSGNILDQVQFIPHKPSISKKLFDTLDQFLDNRYTLVDSAMLSGFSEPFPPLLLGPTGLWLINISATSGIFRINGESWEQLSDRSGAYRPAKPNPVLWTVEKARMLSNQMSNAGIKGPPVEPVIYFFSPDAHIEHTRPAARVVLVDGVQRFINLILTAQIVLDRDTIQAIIVLFCPATVQTEPLPEITDSYALKEAQPVKPPRAPTRLEEIARSEPQIVTKLSRKLSLTRTQWIWIGLLIAINITILIILVFVVVFNT